MKKILTLALTLVLLSCSSDSDENTNNNNSSSNQITPPSWIQGTWANETIYIESGLVNGYKFVPNDACIVNLSYETCYAYNSTIPGSQISFEQISTNNEYKLVMKSPLQTATLFHFIKIDDTHIKDIKLGDDDVLPMIYVKVN